MTAGHVCEKCGRPYKKFRVEVSKRGWTSGVAVIIASCRAEAMRIANDQVVYEDKITWHEFDEDDDFEVDNVEEIKK